MSSVAWYLLDCTFRATQPRDAHWAETELSSHVLSICLDVSSWPAKRSSEQERLTIRVQMGEEHDQQPVLVTRVTSNGVNKENWWSAVTMMLSLYSQSVNWQCDRRKQHAVLDYTGKELQCDRRKQHAVLDYTGKELQCDRHKQHAVLDYTGKELQCDRRKQHAVLDYTGKELQCDRRKQHAVLDYTGKELQCDRHKQHAVLDYTGKELQCDRRKQHAVLDYTGKELQCDRRKQHAVLDYTGKEFHISPLLFAFADLQVKCTVSHICGESGWHGDQRLLRLLNVNQMCCKTQHTETQPQAANLYHTTN